MFSLPFAHKREKVIAIADVASDSAGACIALVRDNEPASIICAERSSLSYDEKSPEQTEAGVLSLLEDASAKVLRTYSKLPGKSAARAISSVHAIIHTPLITSQTSSAVTSFEQEESITKDIIGNLAKSALSSGKMLESSRLFEAGVASVELNGYRTGKPIGKHAHNVSVATLTSECEPELRAQITERLRKGFGVQNPVLHSDTRALLHVTHMNPVHTNRHFIIDVSGNSTNCIVIHKDTAAEHIVVSEGVRTILKRIVGNGMAEETLSLMRMVSRDACNTPACDQLNASLARVETELVKIFGEAFGKLMSVRRLPNDLVLIVNPDFAPWMNNFFSRIDFGQFTVTTRQFAVHTLGAGDLGASVAQHPSPKVDAWLTLGTALGGAQE
ncbi:MAG: hypothetical protein Q7S08_01340 [bacterium]|nr:hypothetical protein [bacterium]